MDIEQLVVENASWIRSKANIYYQNRELADDLAGEVIYKILRSKERFDGNRAFRPWAMRIMKNTYITEYNRGKCVTFMILEDSDQYGAMAMVDTDQLASIGTLTGIISRCAEVSVNIECVLMFAQGYDYEEISRMKDIPLGTVRSRISNGRKTLKMALGY